MRKLIFFSRKYFFHQNFQDFCLGVASQNGNIGENHENDRFLSLFVPTPEPTPRQKPKNIVEKINSERKK